MMFQFLVGVFQLIVEKILRREKTEKNYEEFSKKQEAPEENRIKLRDEIKKQMDHLN